MQIGKLICADNDNLEKVRRGRITGSCMVLSITSASFAGASEGVKVIIIGQFLASQNGSEIISLD
ncbi:hypothetical protein JZM24_14325 [Candidatus Sodalis endolongispinus]|uniref:Uncharacterized protein n=1 Tax=Candidatus Sodalis endolongispinus TaxID=2812662 RepID=A0ABS5YDA6_9GAMM|nr:hypothetical protein [Candidatus Sodalis endolongispinus]MBT9433014.1 hypothetical protein [Candidatus Sodalis endolongispinus]